jgi:acyl transferase domain-containing protein
MAIAGGIQLLIDPSFFVGFSQAGILSRSGRCAVFDEKADGMVLGEGAGLVLLKPLSNALRDGDRILATILGSAVNNDGHTMGITTPSLEAQQEVIAAAYAQAGIDPLSMTYLEAHGTGTALGDPLEIKAASQIFRKVTTENQFCAVGSVKSNVGHLLRAAGIAGFLKVVLALQNRMIPPTLHCTRPHPRFRFADSPFYPVTRPQEWKPRQGVRRAGISAFGFGGTNCHLLVEEFDASARGHTSRRAPLPPTVFRRKRYWAGRPTAPVDEGLSDAGLRELLRGLSLGRITVGEARTLIHR